VSSCLWPLIDRAVRVDLRELFLDIPQQTCVTRDNAPINIDFLVYWKVVDPYLDALRALGASPATKIVFPLEFTTLLRPFAGGAISGEGGGAR
jgi:regulator of protease activity HflC (stomatin/prohibitin superfamily)